MSPDRHPESGSDTKEADWDPQFNDWLRRHQAGAESYFRLDPARRGRALREMADLGVPLDTWPFVLTPQILPASAVAALQSGLTSILDGIDILLREMFHHDPERIADALELPSWQHGLYRIAPDQDWARIARPDIVFAATGRPWFVELNPGTSLGGLAMSDVLSRTYDAWPEASDFLRRTGVTHVDTMRALAAHLAAADRLDRSTLVVVAYWGHEEDNVPPHAYRGLVTELGRYGITAAAAAVEDLDIAGQYITLDGKRVDALYRFFDESDGTISLKETLWNRLMEHVEAGTVTLIGNMVGDVYVNKAFLAILSEEADSGRLPTSVAAGIQTALPWTRRVDKVADAIVAQRQDFVLKPADGCSGQGVVFGRTTDQRAWEDAVERAVTDERQWITQRVVAPPVRRLATSTPDGLEFADYTTQTGVFAIGRRFAGGIRRCDPTRGLNVTPSLGAAQGSVHVC